jgi:3-oxoacyl-[acyl-carrier-protein] synthase-3
LTFLLLQHIFIASQHFLIRRKKMAKYAKIMGTGSFVPSDEHPNAEFRERFGTEIIDKNESASGIMTRFYSPEDWCTSDLAVAASKKALDDAGLKAEDIDLIVLGTDTPDHITPATSVVVQHKLGAKNAGTFDVGCACASFPTGLSIAAGMMSNQGNIKKALVIGVYMMQRLADKENDPMSFYYGDGAGAAVLSVSDKPGFISSALHADGSYSDCWGIYAGGTREPATVEAVKEGKTQVRLLKPFPSSVNREGWPQRVREVAWNGNFEIKDIDHIVFTQVRSKTITQVMEELELPEEKAIKIMHEYGYMGSACLPVAFDIALERKLVKEGDLVVFVGSGVGYNQCAAAFRL